MEDTASSGNTAIDNVAETPKLTAKKAAKAKPKAKSAHPPTSKMVTTAIKELKDRKGSSLQAIKKYIVSTYKVDGEKVTPFIKRYLKTAVSSGSVVQTKGKGASGSFRLSTVKISVPKPKTQRSPKEKKTVDKSVEKKTTAASKVTSASKKSKSPKKAETPKKAADQKKAKASPTKATIAKAGAKTAAAATAAAAAAAAAAAPEKKTTKKAAQAKNISKTKKTAKAPAAKTKTPKPKRTTTAKASAKK